MGLTLTPTVQNNRKGLVLTDSTPQLDEQGAPAGWGVDYEFYTYATTGTQQATLLITIDHYDGSTEDVFFNLTLDGWFDDVTEQSSLVFNLVKHNGEYRLYGANHSYVDEVEELPDGVYTIIYTLTTSTSDVTNSQLFVFDKKAEYILESKANNLDAKIFASNTTDLVQLIDIVMLESMLFVVNRSDALGKKDIILTMLKAINQGEYDYYRD